MRLSTVSDEARLAGLRVSHDDGATAEGVVVLFASVVHWVGVHDWNWMGLDVGGGEKMGEKSGWVDAEEWQVGEAVLGGVVIVRYTWVLRGGGGAGCWCVVW